MEQKTRGQASKDHCFLSALFAVFACGACLIEKGRSRSEAQDDVNEFRGFEWDLPVYVEFFPLTLLSRFYEKAQLFFWMGIGSSQIEQSVKFDRFWCIF